MNGYVEKLIESGCVCSMNDTREINTDRMGAFDEQNVTLVWEGYSSKGGVIALTYDEVEILFKRGLIKNVDRGEDGKLYRKYTYSDIRIFNGAIVCGILAPSTCKEVRPEIIDYAKKMGYISEEMTPVKMESGTKSLIFNSDGTYSIFFAWYDNILQKIKREWLEQFTKNFFSDKSVTIKNDGLLLTNLSEEEVFSRENIDIFRKYDIQLFYLDPAIDKTLLLRAVMQRAFINLPCNTLRKGYFEKVGNIEIPEDRQECLTFNEFGKRIMNCGTLYHYNDSGFSIENYRYKINVPYTEHIRELMIDAEKIFEAKYANDSSLISFSPFEQEIYIYFKNKEIRLDIERDFIALDYAITFLQNECKFNRWQLYHSIISLLEADSSGHFANEYFSYLEMLKRVLPEKGEFM